MSTPWAVGQLSTQTPSEIGILIVISPLGKLRHGSVGSFPKEAGGWTGEAFITVFSHKVRFSLQPHEVGPVPAP